MIRVEGVSFRYPGAERDSLQGVSLTIPTGSLFGLIGPNGAGKTTLISLITGLLPLQTGSITLDGDGNHGKSIGYIPQEYAFYPNLSARENLEFFAGVQGLKGAECQRRIRDCLAFCQLETVANQRAGRFSGGLKRRLNIAIGLLKDAPILFFDEPTVSIDPQSRAFILGQIQVLRERGKTILYTSHYMEEVEQLCDHLAIIDHGQLLCQGTLAELGVTGEGAGKSRHRLEQLFFELTDRRLRD